MPFAIPQPITARLTRAAVFLVVTVKPGQEHRTPVQALCADMAALLRTVGFRDLDGRLSCVMAFGSDAWNRFFGQPRPKDLHPFREIRGRHHAVSTPGDIFFHIRAMRMDLCFELAAQIMSRLGAAVSSADEVHGFKYFDNRDLIGFVDGTENPADQAAIDATVIGDEDAAFAGGSYVLVQKYLHDLQGWNALTVEDQVKIIGRDKLSNVELDDAVKPTSAHNALTTIVENGKQLDIVRDNMPFGDVSKGEFGTCFVGMPAPPTGSSRCSSTCSSAGRRAITTACSISVAPSPVRCFSCRRRRSWTMWTLLNSLTGATTAPGPRRNARASRSARAI